MSPERKGYLWRACARIALVYLRRAHHLAPQGYAEDLGAIVRSVEGMTRGCESPLRINREELDEIDAEIAVRETA